MEKTGAFRDQTQDTPSGNPTHDTREEASEPVSHQDTAHICMESSGVRSGVVTSKLEMSETEMIERTDLLDVELQQVLVTCSRDASRQITLTTEPRRDSEQTVSPSPPQLPLHPQAFDSHFQLDRTARQYGKDVTLQSPDGGYPSDSLKAPTQQPGGTDGWGDGLLRL